MAVSGSGNISPSGPNNWDPSIHENTPESTEGTKGLVFSDSRANSTDRQEAVVMSGTTATYETEKTINEGKYKKTQEKASTSTQSRLRSKFSRVSASIQGFLSGFGTRASRVSARIAEANGEGRSMLPSSMDMVGSKNNRISPEMRGFYLDASGLGESSSDISRLSIDSLQSTSLSTTELLSSVDEKISASTASSISSFGSVQTAREVNSLTVESWTRSRLGGEMISSLLDPNVETSSLLRRASVVSNEGMIDLSDLGQENLSTSMSSSSSSMSSSSSSRNTKIISTGEDAGKIESVDVDSSGMVQQSIKENEKKELQEDILKEQLALAGMMASLLTSGESSSVYVPVDPAVSSSGTSFPAPKISGTIKKFYDKKTHLPPGIENVKSQTNFSSDNTFSRMDSSALLGARSESAYRFPKDSGLQEGEIFNNSEEGATSFVDDTGDRVFDPVPDRSSFQKYDSSATSTEFSAISSAYLFPADRGMSLLSPTPISVDDYKRELSYHKGPGGPPDPLIYQYRNVSVDPPLILRSPQPFSSSSRISVQGKPEAASVHDDGGGFSGNGGFSDQEKEQGGNRNLPKTKKSGSNLKSRD
ncbi:hypothetical protein [Chlamydia avium]|uniref:Uncharacterized protein n=1 Tax=Chlamydia avium TaxID=1457141 RepID=A0ABN0MRR1_9CHLA|nr:hypothetical protein [Chlamydia avium]EPP36822.1 hypothetical protein CP10743SC13_0581 [Chlamydia psittaci 10_743_SC13]EPP38126.1 hypothetical protein CP10881SC42_0664 [Chlamydia avium]